jgi:hypothetical protein
MAFSRQWFNRVNRYRLSVFLLTFLSYAVYTATRLPYSITKSTLDPDDGTAGWAPFDSDKGSFYLGALDATFLVSYGRTLCSVHARHSIRRPSPYLSISVRVCLQRSVWCSSAVRWAIV